MGTLGGETLLSPSAQHILTILESRIQSGEYLQGRWLPSEREIAQEFGVSRIIVQSVVKDLEKRQLVARAARCRPIVQGIGGQSRRPLSSRQNIGLWIWPHPGDPSHAMIVRGIRKALDNASYRLVVESPIETGWQAVQKSEERFLYQMAHDRDILGVILYFLGGRLNLPAMEALRKAGVPLVFIDRRPPEEFPADFVGVDNVRSAESIVRHLLEQGHRSIAHISNMDNASTVMERHQGYRHALENAGLPYRPEFILRDPDAPGDDPNSGMDALLDTLMRLPDPPTAIFAVSDYVAFRVLAALKNRGLHVPEQVAVAGFDGVERYRPGQPFLTTACQPFENLGERAAEALLHRIERESGGEWQHILLEAPLQVNPSSRFRRIKSID